MSILSILWMLIDYSITIITILIIAKVVLSYFMSPYHPVRMTIDRIVEPLLNPIRRVVPPVGMLDLSPIVLIVLLQISGTILKRIITSF
jgi:YggT family protein